MDSSSSTKFLDVDLKITETCYHPKEVLVKFQGCYKTECDFDYHILHHEIQQVSKIKEAIGIGEFCLVEDPDCGEWYRGRVIKKKKDMYDVFLIDSGKVLVVHETSIAFAIDELFQLPPKTICGIFANILPIEEKWAPKALNYFSSLVGLQIKGHVQAILPHQIFLLDVAKITSDVVELKLGKLVDQDTFHLLVEMLTELPQEPLCKQMPDLLQQKYTRPDSVFCNARIPPDFEPALSGLQPVFAVGKVEKVKISVAVSSSKFYCQLVRCQKELDELITRMSSYYEMVSRENVPSCDSLGILCAARQINGQWHRGVIQQLLSENKVKIWFIDFGNYKIVPSSCVLKLQPEFISVPRFSFPCAMSCLSDPDEIVRNNQLKIFKEALLRQSPVHAHIDLFSANEHLYYVTLHKCESMMNSEYLFQGSNKVSECCLSEITHRDMNMNLSERKPVFAGHVVIPQSADSSDKKDTLITDSPLPIPCKRVELKINSVYVAFVEYVLNPSNFWVQINDYLGKFETMMKRIADVYDASQTDCLILENPEPGNLCCARYNKDMHFYRAIIEEVGYNSINVYFLDFGNTETVLLSDVRTLLPEFQELPSLAICCSLANAFAIQDVWIKKETDFFKKIVSGKSIKLHVIAKQNNKYIVTVQCMNDLEQVDLLMCMVQAGYAEYWEVQQDQFLNIPGDSKKEKPFIKKNKLMIPKNADQNIQLSNTHTVPKDAAAAFASSSWWKSIPSNKSEKAFGKVYSFGPYKNYRFKPGMVLDVVCCCSTSPGDFSCQMQTRLPELDHLMGQMQCHYNTCTNLYERGQLACVVKRSEDGQWYRAAVQKHVSGTEVDVVFVDFGIWERVLLKDIQAIIPDFLTLECQAFRCCLNSVPESSVFDPYKWTAEECCDFQRFISSSNGRLTCTISALILRSPNYLYNLVDLQTPFVTAQQFLLECGHAQFYAFELARSLVPSFSLYSFYYSSFNLKIGSEEDVCVTHICSPTKFYCQLNRNASDIDKLSEKISEISQATNCPSQLNTHNLYLAQYLEDGLFYRALASPAGSSDYLVYFVDFGNKQIVAKEKLILIPDHASEILFTPMQAVKCYLSDLRDTDIPADINTWFEKNCLGKELKAIIVSKESDGQLGVELYDGNLQINKKIKEDLKVVKKKCDADPKGRYTCAKKSIGDRNVVHKVKLDAVKLKDKNEIVGCEREAGNRIHSCYQRDGQVCARYGKEIMDDLQKECSSPIKLPVASENTEHSKECLQDHTVKGASGELNANTIDDSTLALKEIPTGSRIELHDGRLSHSGQDWNSTTRQKYTNLVQRNIQPNARLAGFIAFVVSPSHFHISLAEDENKIVWLADKLNGGTLVLEPEKDSELEEGDLVLAEYEVDCCIYRAVVWQVISEDSFEVEFIDYGNVSVVNASKIYKMEEPFLKLPRFSIHCSLKTKCGFPDNWNDDIATYFISKVSNQPVVCEFLQPHGQQWEVDLFCHGMSITNELMQREVSLGSQKMLDLNLDKVAEQLSLTDTDDQTQKSESQTVHEVSEPRQTWAMHPAIICDQIKPGQLEMAEIGHVLKDGKFYVKLTKNIQILSYLNVMTAQEADKNPVLPMENIKEGLEYLTKSAETLKWYRSEVVKKFVDKENMLVFFMDLGKYEIVPLCNVKMLSSKIRSIPRNSVLCKLVAIEHLGDLPFERVVEVIMCHEIKIWFLKYLEYAFIWEVDILVDGVLLLEHCNQIYGQRKLEQYKLPGSINYVGKKMHASLFRLNSIAWAPFQNNRCYPGFVTAATDPSNFCIQLEDSFEVLKTLFKLLSDLPDSLLVMPWELIVPGTSCLIKIGSSKKWNRVEVSEVSNLVTLTFIDDEGLSIPIPVSDIHKLKVIPDNLVRLPRLTYPCSLFGVLPTDGLRWSDEAKLKIQTFLGRQGLVFQFKQHRHGRLEVDVLCGQQSAASLLIASGCAVCSKIAPSSGSFNCAEVYKLNPQIPRDPLQIYNQGSGAGVALPLKKGEGFQQLDSHFKCACHQASRVSSSNRLCKRRELQKTHNNKRNDKSLLCKEHLWETSPIGILSKAMHDLLALSTEIGGIKIHKKSM